MCKTKSRATMFSIHRIFKSYVSTHKNINTLPNFRSVFMEPPRMLLEKPGGHPIRVVSEICCQFSLLLASSSSPAIIFNRNIRIVVPHLIVAYKKRQCFWTPSFFITLILYSIKVYVVHDALLCSYIVHDFRIIKPNCNFALCFLW